MTFIPRPYILTNKIQHYAWGERGQPAYIAQLLELQGVENDTPFAELWMGTHPLGTSTLDYEGRPMPLSELVQRYPLEILGARVASSFENQFPFLLKVLSANEPLSIQVHPSKDEAAVLHSKDPAHYPDTNHKPEVAIVVERLHALAGLREGRQIEKLLKDFPELGNFLGITSFHGEAKHGLAKLAFLSLLRNAMEKPGELAKVADHMAGALRKKSRPTYRERLFLEMCAKYPGDVGLFSIFFLKLFSLKKGEAVFIPAGVPHAYLKGNIVECMASSDNVIRAGLTEKFKDIPALLEVVTDKAVIRYAPAADDYVYPTPAREFRVSRFELKMGRKLSDRNDSARLLLVLRGKLRLTWQGGAPRTETGTLQSLEIGQGQSVLLPASLNEVGIECLEKSEIYKAEVPI